MGGMLPAGGTVAGGGAVLGAIPVVAGGLISLLAVLSVVPLVKTSASTTTMNRAPAIHPQGVGLESISILRSKSRGSVMTRSPIFG